MAVPGIAGLLLSAAAFGLSFFIGPAAITAFSRKNLPETDWGRSVTLFTTVFALGQTLAPVAAGLISDAAQRLSLALAAGGAILLAGAVVALMQKPLAPIARPSAGAKAAHSSDHSGSTSVLSPR
jgi:hypothetical protein